MDEIGSYEVTSPLRHGGKNYGVGDTVEMSRSVADYYSSCISAPGDKEAVVAGHEAQNQKLIADLAERDETISGLNARVAEQDETISGLNAKIGSLDAELLARDKTPKSRDKTK